MKPRSPARLHDYIRVFYKLYVPDVRVCPGHSSPFDYVVGSFFDNTDGWTEEEKKRYKPHRNSVVDACRGGSKTVCGGLTSHLDSIHRAGCVTRVLGGSKAQSERMYEHKTAFDGRSFMDLVDGKPQMIRTRYGNGSLVEILVQSQTSVRGPHCPRLKMDEVDEFDREIYKAALGIPQSQNGIQAKVEIFSTLHKVHGLMSDVMESAGKDPTTAVYLWCIFEVLEQCRYECSLEKPNMRCSSLVKYDSDGREVSFFDVCRCKAKRSDGYYKVEDLQDKFMQMPWETFQCEMLCQTPKRDDAIYPMLDLGLHELAADYRSQSDPIILGFDAGLNNNFAAWAQVRKDDTIVVIRELYPNKQMGAREFAALVAAEHVRAGYRKALCGYCGKGDSDSNLRMELNRAEVRGRLFVDQVGGTPRGKAIESDNVLASGYEALRRRLQKVRGADGKPTAKIYFSPCCRILITQVAKLHSKKNIYGEAIDEQEKVDDHGPDALRYMVRGWDLTRARLLATGARAEAQAVLL